MRWARAISSATEGAGSNVCEFVPSGTSAMTVTRSPPTFSMMSRRGETVVTTRIVAAAAGSASRAPPPSPSPPPAGRREGQQQQERDQCGPAEVARGWLGHGGRVVPEGCRCN